MTVAGTLRFFMVGGIVAATVSANAEGIITQSDSDFVYMNELGISTEQFLNACNRRMVKESEYYEETKQLLGGLSCEEFIRRN